ncbi:MAG: nucleotide exchange factor GrpE [Oscillospiraceae bacterium]|nr:nucleotide exchange factor GrpE [Oscillospiraceae bacterium]
MKDVKEFESESSNQENNIDQQEENQDNILDDSFEDSLEKKFDKLDNDYKELNNKYLRCLAEYDNFRKRTTKEKERIFSDGLIFSVKGVLDVLDNFERALEFQTQDTEMKKGFEMIFNQLVEVIKKLGVEEIKTEGEVFDPAFHNAVMHIEDDKYGQGQIVQTLQKGYKLGDNIIRYAMVKVAN